MSSRRPKGPKSPLRLVDDEPPTTPSPGSPAAMPTVQEASPLPQGRTIEEVRWFCDHVARELNENLHHVRSMLDDLYDAVRENDIEGGQRARDGALEAVRAAELEVELLEVYAR